MRINRVFNNRISFYCTAGPSSNIFSCNLNRRKIPNKNIIMEQQTLSWWCLPCFEPIRRWLWGLTIILQHHAEEKSWSHLGVFTAQQWTPTRILEVRMTKLCSWHQRPDITFINYCQHHCENNFSTWRKKERITCLPSCTERRSRMM